MVSRRRAVNGTLVVVARGFSVCPRALVERHALVPEGTSVPGAFRQHERNRVA